MHFSPFSATVQKTTTLQKCRRHKHNMSITVWNASCPLLDKCRKYTYNVCVYREHKYCCDDGNCGNNHTLEFINKDNSAKRFFQRKFVSSKTKGKRWASPLWGPFPVHAHGLFKDTVNQATRSREGARQGEQWQDSQVEETLMES